MLEQFDIITLSNKRKYTVAELLKYNNKEYLLLIEVNDNEDLLEDKIIAEKVKTSKGYGIKSVNDEKILIIISDKFIEMLKNEKL